MTKDSFLYKFYTRLIASGERFQSLLLLAIRLFWGWGFFQSGLGKFYKIPGTAAFFESLGIPLANLSVYAVASIEVVGGLLLMIGFASRLAAIPLIALMLGAYLTVHLDAVKNLFSDPSQFVDQPPFNYLLACLTVFAFGPGKISLDHLIVKLMGASKR